MKSKENLEELAQKLPPHLKDKFNELSINSPEYQLLSLSYSVVAHGSQKDVADYMVLLIKNVLNITYFYGKMEGLDFIEGLFRQIVKETKEVLNAEK